MKGQFGERVDASMLVTFGRREVTLDGESDRYDREFVAQFVALPGFLEAERWMHLDGGPCALMIFDVTALDVIRSPACRALCGDGMSPLARRVLQHRGGTQYEAEITHEWRKPGQEEAEGLLFVGMNVESAIEDEFNRWYTEEHVPLLFGLPGVLGARRYRSDTGGRKYLATYWLATPEVQAAAEWKKAADTSWASVIRPHTRDRVRLVCRR